MMPPPPPTDLPTWEILPTADGHFQWAAAAGDPGVQPEPPLRTLARGVDSHPDHRLPSMADLSTLARPKLPEGGDGGRGDGERFPMFRTGTGRAVSVSESSIRKARSVLGGAGDTDTSGSIRHGIETTSGGQDDRFPLFRTGSGKSVTIKESSLRKAAVVLEGNGINKGDKVTLDVGAKDELFPMFSTGSGKAVTVKESSIRKAAAIFIGENMEKESPNPLQCGRNNHDGHEKSVLLDPSSTEKALSIIDGSNPKTEQLHENFRWDMNQETAGTSLLDCVDVNSVQRSPENCINKFCSTGSYLTNGQLQKTLEHKLDSSDCGQSPVKFQTAGGRYVSISNDALKRARNLLGESDIEVSENNITLDQPLSSVLRNKNNLDDTFWNKENISSPHSPHCGGMGKLVSRTPPSLTKRRQFSLTRKIKSDSYTLDQENARSFALENIYSGNKTPVNQKPEKDDLHSAGSAVEIVRRIENGDGMSLGGPLIDISNIAGDCMNMNRLPNEKRRPGKTSYISPFKRPRSSRFITPLKGSTSLLATGSSKPSTTESSSCGRISTRYPFQLKRKNLKDFFGGPPTCQDLSGSLPHEVSNMDADNAVAYRFYDAFRHDEIGLEAFQGMLLKSGASSSNATKEWVANHYRWIIWKLASFERCYSTQVGIKFLTVCNVLEELKYRYEREVNYGHRSVLKKILDGDASPASMMVLCVSAIHSTSRPTMLKANDSNYPDEDIKKLYDSSSTETKFNCQTRIELTDGWYSLDALLDVWLSKQLAAGKLFVGQKLRICGAGLCGWVGPVSSLEASKTVHMLIHINGTYRAQWDEKLGFCKRISAPLAFSCIKASGGKIPRTLVGITRVYPVLYKERFPDGAYVVRSERLEKKALQIYNQRRCNIAEAIMSEQLDVFVDINDGDEGAKLCKILETAADPEVLMADMTSEQLFSFSTYQAKQKEIRQSHLQKMIEKALKDAGVASREVTPFMRVRVAGLTSKYSCRKGRFREGLITIWSPTEDQKVDLVEGKIYDVSGLMPLNFSMDVLYLQGGGYSTVWKNLPSTEADKYEPFFNPRKSVNLSNLGEIPLASEFDIAAMILHVEDVCMSGRQKKQWIFITDGCNCSSTSQYQEQHDCLLAVSFSSPMVDKDLFSHHHEGTVVGFYNLVKRARDQTNHLWVAEATENSTYSVSYNLPRNCHLKVAATSAHRWAKLSYLTIQKLKERISYILGHHEISR
ncbi:protein BREAST CANCER SUSCEPTIBILITY 2 homolog B-like [Musa acuminata AAA Group]|uniref:protein BREAST CANCER SUSCEPTIBILITY 2 homolog B-like n=1 Tax=Musa acuminata AAA Group TaxID=214697 RepID=UPI0031CE5A57